MGASALLVAVVIVLLLLARRAQKSAATHVTWGCGYTAPNSRMQYSGTSFSSQFAALFKAILPQLRREKLPDGYFPKDGHLATHHVDAVERRMFQMLGDGESLVTRLISRISDQPRFGFAIGLVTLAAIVGLILFSARSAP